MYHTWLFTLHFVITEALRILPRYHIYHETCQTIQLYWTSIAPNILQITWQYPLSHPGLDRLGLLLHWACEKHGDFIWKWPFWNSNHHNLMLVNLLLVLLSIEMSYVPLLTPLHHSLIRYSPIAATLYHFPEKGYQKKKGSIVKKVDFGNE